jgi:frataxin-like iron-binding protein CyaY
MTEKIWVKTKVKGYRDYHMKSSSFFFLKLDGSLVVSLKKEREKERNFEIE